MRNVIVAAIVCVALFSGLPVAADEGNQKTTLTFSQPIELPGIVLPAGKYVFKVAESGSNRSIIQVWNAEETNLFATILAVPDYRLTATSDTVIHFEERPVGRPDAIRAWFYPGRLYGHEFVYPKKRATELAQVSHQPVPFAEVKPKETAAELQKEPIAAVTPEKKEVEVAQAIQVTPPARTEVAQAQPPAPAPAPAELPKTASPLPYIALGGLFSLAIAGALKLSFKRAS